MASESSETSSVVDAKTCGMLVLVYWLCCCMWYEDKSENTSRHPSRAEITHDNGGRRRSSEFFSRRIGSSAVSLHLPSTSGHKKSLSAHRSHEEIGRRKSHNDETRYHSAPSVIDEVLHRRDWERSTKDLYIPLNPVRNSDGTDSPEKAPHAEPESSSIECLKSDEVKPCKKHHTNIKSSKKKAEGNKEKATSDDKDCDVTEQTFYIGDTIEDSNFDNTELEIRNDNNLKVQEKPAKVCKAKEAKQSLNESIRSKERPKPALMPLAEHQHAFTFSLDEVIERLDTLEPLDRSGAYHHGIESRISGTRSTYPPPSVESDLDLDLEGGEERPPPYDELHQYASPQKKETAI
ncbi:uncharacterized protein LOC119193632 isoform X1 [Manduca sexta]|uniref:uncharacterized protein LOC119193632 isoform X1 n=1 Tax=Manduca sexta TaxID=7130 RepID=UPI001890434A|nr:uncharacterized protein LOC119193632 isoform X1 [Manduca sexta]